jgi:hypothetical protein
VASRFVGATAIVVKKNVQQAWVGDIFIIFARKK